MENKDQKLILKKRDYELLLRYIFSRMTPLSAENRNAEQLYHELASAEIHEDDRDIPADTVRINSLVEVQEKETARRLKFRLVLPGESNLGKGKLSVFAPLGIALIGYRKGELVTWEMPSGKKQFYISEVINGD